MTLIWGGCHAPGQVLKKGRFQRVGDTLTVRAGDALELRCKGTPVQWSVPPYLGEDNEGRLRYPFTMTSHLAFIKSHEFQIHVIMEQIWAWHLAKGCLQYLRLWTPHSLYPTYTTLLPLISIHLH